MVVAWQRDPPGHGILHVINHLVDGTTLGEITDDEVQAAWRIGHSLEAHARRVFDVVTVDENMVRARKVWAWTVRRRERILAQREKEHLDRVPALKVGDIARYEVAGLREPAEIRSVLGRLEAKGYLQPCEFRRTGTKAKPHQLWYWNPLAMPDGRCSGATT